MKARVVKSHGKFYVVFSKKGTVKNEDANGIWLTVKADDVQFFLSDLKEAGQYREE